MLFIHHINFNFCLSSFPRNKRDLDARKRENCLFTAPYSLSLDFGKSLVIPYHRPQGREFEDEPCLFPIYNKGTTIVRTTMTFLRLRGMKTLLICSKDKEFPEEEQDIC
jgi:hypothetical protein